MSDNRKYYYLKLKENYFDDDSIVLLESMQDGVLYSNHSAQAVSEIAETWRTASSCSMTRTCPYTAQMIATITRQQMGTVETEPCRSSLKLGLVEVLDRCGTFYMSNIELLIGQSSTEGERKKERMRLKRPKQGSYPRAGQMADHLSGDIRPPEIEIRD